MQLILSKLVVGAISSQHAWIMSLQVDYRGHGMSDVSRDLLSLSGVLLDIQAAVRFACVEAKGLPLMAAGHSFAGGMVYLEGMTNPSIDSVFLSMPVLSYIDDITRVNPEWEDVFKPGEHSFIIKGNVY